MGASRFQNLTETGRGGANSSHIIIILYYIVRSSHTATDRFGRTDASYDTLWRVQCVRRMGWYYILIHSAVEIIEQYCIIDYIFMCTLRGQCRIAYSASHRNAFPGSDLFSVRIRLEYQTTLPIDKLLISI